MLHTADLLLNAGFFGFHTLWIVFTCVGWIWRRTRRLHLAAIALTAFSWFGLGPWYGWGYCPFTDWHWRIRERLGYDDPPSYIQLLVRVVTGIELAPHAANGLAIAVLASAAVLSVYFNFARQRKRSS